MAKEEQMNQDDAVIILTDEDGNETSYLMLDVVEYKDAAYAILIPEETDPEAESAEVLILLMEEGDEEDEMILSTVEDDKILDEVFHIFAQRAEDEYEIEE